MKHAPESISRAIALVIVGAVALILALSFVGYVGERIVTIATQTHRSAP